MKRIALLLTLCACGAAQERAPRASPSPEEAPAPVDTTEEAVVEAPPPPLRNAQGVGWTLRDGRFVSAVGGLAISDSEDWRFARDPSLTPGAVDFALRHASGTTFSAYGFDTHATVPEAMLTAFHPTLDEVVGPGDEALTIPVGEASVELRQHAQDYSGVFAGIHIVGTRVLYFQLAYSGTDIDAVRSAARTLPPLHVLMGDELDAATEAARQERAQRVSRTSSLRDNVFQDFESGARLILYPGAWQAALGQGALIAATERIDNITFTLGHTRASGMSASEAHAQLRTQVFGEADAPRARRVDFAGARGLVSEATIPGIAAERRRAISILRDDEVVWFHIAAPAASFEAASARIAELEASIRFQDPVPPTSIEGDLITDRRFGLRIQVPAGYSPSPIAAPTHSAYLLHAGSNELALFVFPDTPEAAAHVARLKERTASDLGAPAQVDGAMTEWPEGQVLITHEAGGARIVAIQLFAGTAARDVIAGITPMSDESEPGE